MSLLYTYYGDDFTGSTDVLEQLGANGISAVLFVGIPKPQHVSAFPDVRAIGIAGDSRSRSPEWMSDNLPAIFGVLRDFGAPITHYKVCSTFDSSPTIGSIGRAAEIGREVFGSRLIPIVVGAPHLGRYVVFGHLFAKGPDGVVQRIDRHVMSRHPVTPMRESDLRMLLSAQTAMSIALIDVTALKVGRATIHELDWIAEKNYQTAVFDTVDEANLSTIGGWLWNLAQKNPLFAVGSSGLSAALVSEWSRLGFSRATAAVVPIKKAKPLLVLSGSCSPVTERQIRYAIDHEFFGLRLDPKSLLNEDDTASSALLESARRSLASGHDTLLYTALGEPGSSAYGDALGIALGRLLSQLLQRNAHGDVSVRRMVICGGDTSSHAVQQLGIHALTWISNIQPGAPLCCAHSDSYLDGMELVLKGGQVGTEDFFDRVRGNDV